ncbi:hypothetical protein BT69DRAFT_619064 [Atractiella rhizophila]|nr:hypothetical protein BT69DRAFT_619064 [Atractiella rhizophila]
MGILNFAPSMRWTREEMVHFEDFTGPIYTSELVLQNAAQANPGFDWSVFYDLQEGSREWRALLDGLAQDPQHLEMSSQTYVRSIYFNTVDGAQGKEEWTLDTDSLIRSEIIKFLYGNGDSDLRNILVNVNLSLRDLRATNFQPTQPRDPQWCILSTGAENVSFYQPSVERFYCSTCDRSHVNPELLILRDCSPAFTQYPVELAGKWDVVAVSFGDRRYEHPWVVLSVVRTEG